MAADDETSAGGRGRRRLGRGLLVGALAGVVFAQLIVLLPLFSGGDQTEVVDSIIGMGVMGLLLGGVGGAAAGATT